MLDGLAYGIREQKGVGDWTMAIQEVLQVQLIFPGHVELQRVQQIILSISFLLLMLYIMDRIMHYCTQGLKMVAQHGILRITLLMNLGPNIIPILVVMFMNLQNPKMEFLLFLVGDAWTDLVLMKSTNDGDTWEKTTIWENPYPLHVTGELTDTFYNCDGSHHLAIDNNGKVHVAFGINRAHADETGEYWFPGVDGVGYWNEDMPAFSDDVDALCPYDDCAYTELVEDYNLIGWSQDINGNGELDILDDWGTYYLGLSSMVQISIDESKPGICCLFISN